MVGLEELILGLRSSHRETHLATKLLLLPG